jgi:MFS family permease
VQVSPRSDESPTAAMAETPRPVDTPTAAQKEADKASLRDRLAGRLVDAAARPPFPIVAQVRLVLGLLLAALCVLTAGGSLLLLMAWRQEETSGLLAGSQTERLWDVWDVLATVERVVALTAVGVGVVWIAVAAVNVRRATGRRRNPVFAAVALSVSAAGAWIAGREVVADALDDDDWVGVAAGIALQAVLVAVSLVAIERLADAAGARRRPFRVAYAMTVGYLVVLQVAGSLATIDRTTDFDSWGRTGALVLIAALVQILAVLAFTEGSRALEEATGNRYELRHRFGESVLLHSGI